MSSDHAGAATLESSTETSLQTVYQPGRHIPQLDGLRGLAILLVTIYRFGREAAESSIGATAHQALKLGSHGVELFFVLSGFLITGILLDSRGQPNQLRNFFVRRSLRILPLYALALSLCLWFMPAIATAVGASSIEQAFAAARDQQIFLWFYLTNVQMALVDAWCFGPLDHFWSLAVEEHFYLLWPLVVVFMRSRWLVGTTLVLAITCVATRTGWLALGGAATAAEVLTVWRCDGLLLGALLAMLVRWPGRACERLTSVTRWAWLPMAAIALAIDMCDRRMWLIHSTLWNGVWFCLLANLLASPSSGVLSKFFDRTWLRNLGKLSYGMYVFQAPLIPVAAALGCTAGVSLPMNLLYVGSMFALTIGVAWCSWHGFEKHWLRLKDYFPQADYKPVRSVDLDRSNSVWGAVR